jgi:hypothetical protein
MGTDSQLVTRVVSTNFWDTFIGEQVVGKRVVRVIPE